MPGYLQSFEWLRTLWPLLLMAALVSFLLWVAYLAATPKPGRNGSAPDSVRGKAILVIFSFSLLGETIGWLTGDSGHQVLASVLPAVLTLIGGLAVFLVGKQLPDATMIAAALSGLTLNLLVGALLASENALLVKEHELQANNQAFREQVQAETHLKSVTQIDDLKNQIDSDLKKLDRQ